MQRRNAEDAAMSAFELLVMITLALIGQMATLAAIAFYRHWQSYQELRGQVAASGDGDRKGSAPAAPGPPSGTLAWQGLRDFRVQRRVVESDDGSIISFYLAPVDGAPLADFLPGQYLTFHLQINDPTTHRPTQVVRCYSLSDAPDASCYRVTIKRVDAPTETPGAPAGLSSGYFHQRVQVGDVLSVKAPAGHFHLTGSAEKPIVLIGGGIGITPVLSMLRSSLQITPQREVWLFYGVRNGAEHIMKTQLRALAAAHGNFHLQVCYSRPLAGDVRGADYQQAGHVDIALLRQTLALRPYAFYICGPRNMLETLVPALAEWGVTEHDVNFEAFGPASLPKKRLEAAADAPHPTVTFGKSNRSLRWSGRETSLLELAENNAVPVESGCRAGGCGTCQTRITSGEVEYSHEPDFDVESGSCLLCLCVPKTDLTLVA
jgi:ferredoxin-NADP reductase